MVNPPGKRLLSSARHYPTPRMSSQYELPVRIVLFRTDGPACVKPRRGRRSEKKGMSLVARWCQPCPARDFQYPGCRCRCITARTSMRSGLARYTIP